MRRLLVLRGGALGDLLVTLPTLAALRQQWPGARIELVGNARAAELALPAGLLDAAYSQHEARWAPLFDPAPLPAALAEWLAHFDLVLNYWPDPAGEIAAHFPVRPGQEFVTADALPVLAPAAAHFATPLQELGIEVRDLLFPLRSPAADRPFIALHPGSGSPTKNWPLDRWRELATWLRAHHSAPLLVITGEAEPAGLLADAGTEARNLPLNALADRLAACRFFIGHDSGISHLAAACGVPGLLLFGPTDPAMWAPPTADMTLLRRGNAMDALPVAEVISAVAKALAGHAPGFEPAGRPGQS